MPKWAAKLQKVFIPTSPLFKKHKNSQSFSFSSSEIMHQSNGLM